MPDNRTAEVARRSFEDMRRPVEVVVDETIGSDPRAEDVPGLCGSGEREQVLDVGLWEEHVVEALRRERLAILRGLVSAGKPEPLREKVRRGSGVARAVDLHRKTAHVETDTTAEHRPILLSKFDGLVDRAPGEVERADLRVVVRVTDAEVEQGPAARDPDRLLALVVLVGPTRQDRRKVSVRLKERAERGRLERDEVFPT